MARYKGYDYTQTVMVPVSLENQLLPGTLEFAIQALVECCMDTASFASRYKNDETGCPAYDPKILLKVILFAYARGIISSVEPVFGNLRSQKRLDRFTVRGKIKVSIQWMLYCMVHNIEKILHYGMRGESWKRGAVQVA